MTSRKSNQAKPRQKIKTFSLGHSSEAEVSSPGQPQGSGAPICSIPDCTKVAKTRGWCNMHYLRGWKSGEIELLPPPQKSTCLVEECEGLAAGRGWCKKHYERWRRTGSLDVQEREPKVCEVENCQRLAKSRGLCDSHYTRWRTKGAPGASEFRQKTNRSTSMKSGYVRIWEPDHLLAMKDGYVFEHRWVLWDAGVDPRGYDVHHRDHNRQNNEFSNLELRANGDHQRFHASLPGATISNQFGTFPVAQDGQKICRACGETKTWEEFTTIRGSGRPMSYCKLCQVIRVRDYYQRRGAQAAKRKVGA